MEDLDFIFKKYEASLNANILEYEAIANWTNSRLCQVPCIFQKSHSKMVSHAAGNAI